ncbi:alpha/beta hydrolase [Nocardioides panacisoli]|uniref:alpha/beta hydrolase n=1 Tax=Nocardioides panacisoli TaxID=627624 RepID=UPI001C637CF7|nr:alpha/beta hydrolase [Nocardioides panacisoli]QYJ05078.1 alpha/beta hydrolase [Nocardioides panacisoli]
MTDVASLLHRVEPALVRRLLALPPTVLRRLAGRPVVRDGQTLSVETQFLLRLQRLTGRDTLSFGPDARTSIERDSMMIGGDQPIGETRELRVDGGEGAVPARLYVPQALVRSGGADPLLVFFHGGGFVTGSLDSHDAPCRVLAERAGVRVLSVAYRLAPEHPFPAPVEDCAAAYRWVLDHADEVGADPERLGIGGDSAGGNLAAVVAIRAARAGWPLKHQLLIYPVTDMAARTASRSEFGQGFLLTAEAMDQAETNYLGDQERHQPEASPLFADLPAGLAPAHVVTAGFDPLRDEGEAYAAKLEEAGVECTTVRYPSHIHSFFNAVGASRSARTAVDQIGDVLGRSLT